MNALFGSRPASSGEFARIDRQIVVSFVAFGAALVLAFGALFGASAFLQFSRERERHAAVPARLLAPALVAAKAAGEYRMQRLADDAVAQDPSLVFIRVVDAEGTLVQAGPEPPAHNVTLDTAGFRSFMLNGRVVSEATVPLTAGFEGAWRGSLQVGVASFSLWSQLATASVVAVIATIILGGLLLVATRLSLKRVSAPVRRLVAAVEAIDDVVLIVEGGTRVTWANPSFLTKTGLTSREVIGRDPVELLAADDASRTALRRWRDAASWSGRIRARRMAGEPWECAITGGPIPGTPNEVWVGRDVGREVELELHLRRSQKLEAVGQLAGGVAHDFNNLLVVVLMNAGMLLEDETDPDKRETLETITAAGKRAAELTRQLLAFSRRQVMNPKTISLGALAQRSANMFGRVLGSNIEFEVNIEPRHWMIRADEGQLEQVVMNLLLNARDATPGGRVVLSVANAHLDETPTADSTAPAGDYVTLTVTDSGTGMTPEVLAQIFDPFFTTKEAGRGTGLGLSTVLGIVKQSEGYIWVTSQPGQGSSFRLAWPRASVVEEPEPQRAPEARANGELVLLVEDEPLVRKAMARMLSNTGYRVEVADDGLSGLALLENGVVPAVVLSDVMMPRMGGLELRERLAATHPKLPVVLMSGYSAEVLARGGGPLLVKPASRAEVVRALQQAIHGPESLST